MRYRDRKTEDAALTNMEAPIPPSDGWRSVPGYGGAYEINWDGQVRTRRWRGNHFSKKPRLMSAYTRHAGRKGRAVFVKLTDTNGKTHEVKVLHLMVDTYLGGARPGMVPYHKNGILSDNCVNNIGFITREKLGEMTGAKSRRCPVAKVMEDGEIVAVYSSARKAAEANHMSYQTVLDRCHGRVKKPFALDGTTYVFDI